MEVFPLYYAGNIGYFRALAAANNPVFEIHESFPKQTFRNRMEILGPNGRQRLFIPTKKTGNRRFMKDVQIAYEEQWQKDHWKSLEAAYRRSPYFEFYEDELKPVYTKHTDLLMDLNFHVFNFINKALQLNLEIERTEVYIDSVDVDYRSAAFDDEVAPYLQVFSDRHPFESNLSIFDALFNLGPTARDLIVQ